MLMSHKTSDIIKAVEVLTRYWIWRPLRARLKSVGFIDYTKRSGYLPSEQLRSYLMLVV